MAETIGELAVELGIFADTKEANAFQKKLSQLAQGMEQTAKKAKKTNTNIKSLVKGLAGVATAIGGAVLAISKLTDSLVASNQEFLNLTRTSDIALGTFQKWNAVGRMFGVRNAAQQLENLNQKLFELKLTGQGAEGFMFAGINPMGQDANGVMEQLRSRVAGLDDTAAAYLLRQMGLDPSMLHLLRLGRKEFEELGKAVEKYQLTEDQRKDIQAMNAQLEIARIKLQYLKDRAVLKIMPLFVQFMQSIARVGVFLGKVINKLSNFAVIIGIGLSRIKPLVAFTKSFGTEIGALITKLPIVGRLLGALGGIASRILLPFIAIYAILDDILTFAEGGDSVLGDIVNFFKEGWDEFLNADTILEKLQVILNGILEAISNTIDAVINLFNNVFLGGLDIRKIFDIIPNAVAKLTGSPVDIHGNPWETPAMNQRIDNSRHINNSKKQNQQNTFTVNNTINTSQAGQTVLDELAYLQNTAYSYL